MIGTLVGHYRIVSPLGGGSMGEVFKAENTHLSNQFVAIKFLGSRVINKPSSRERFQREAKAITSLNHPNICAVQDAGEYEGRPYIVMEYLDGKSLRDLLTSAPLDRDLVLSLGIQLCDGLQAAHSKGIIHRDIKPANIVLTTTGHAKIVDFGLAKLADSGLVFDLSSLTTEPDTLTGEGALVGTIPYMSPEQALGKPLNQRSDLFSLGVVLYELAGGVHPFRGDTQAAVCSEIIHGDPPSIIRMNPHLPSQFDGFFQRALEKDPECRFQTAADMRATLVKIQRKLQQDSGGGDRKTPEPIPNPWPKRLLRIGIPLFLVLAILFTWNPAFLERLPRMLGMNSLPEKRWVAVLPFDVHCDDDRQRPFVEGLRRDLEGVLLSLSKESRNFKVFPLRSSDEIGTPLEAGKELGVNLALMGSLTCEGGNGIIHLSLVSAEDSGLLERDRIDGSLNDRNQLATRTRRSVRAMLHLRVSVASTGTLAAGPDLEGIFLEGQGFLFRSDDPDSLKKAVERFDRVVEEVPDFAPAHAGLAEAFRHLYSHQPRREWIDRGKASADLAVALDALLWTKAIAPPKRLRPSSKPLNFILMSGRDIGNWPITIGGSVTIKGLWKTFRSSVVCFRIVQWPRTTSLQLTFC
jgi:serine/threonine protein kinase